jgi:hypothetical protein
VIRRMCATRGTPKALPSGPAQRTTTMRKLMFIVSATAAFFDRWKYRVRHSWPDYFFGSVQSIARDG